MPFRSTDSDWPWFIAAAAFVVLSFIAFTGLAEAGCTANAACPGPDADGDGVCDAQDNCVSVANPNQCDTYGPVVSPPGEFGDACEPIASYPELNVVKLTLRGGTVGRGKAVFKGDFILQRGETFTPSTISTRMVDAIDLDLVSPDPNGMPEEPPTVCSSSGKRIRCIQPDHRTGVQTVAHFVVSDTDDAVLRTVKFSVTVRRLSLQGTAFAEPITVTLSHDGGNHRVGQIHDCAPRNGQLRCREF